MDAGRRGDGATDDTTPRPASKVGKLLSAYGLSGTGEDLERRWLGQGYERQSLRSLADHFNQLLLRTELERAGENPVEGEVENLYRLLTEEDVSQANRTEVETQLARAGLDIETLRKDFVSHQAVHTYLTEVRGVELAPGEESSSATIEKRGEVIQRLRGRLVSVTKRSIADLRSSGAVSVGDFDIVVNSTIHCSDCGATQDIGEFLREGSCQCRIDGE